MTVLEVMALVVPIFIGVLFLFRSNESLKEKYTSSRFKFYGLGFGRYKLSYRLFGILMFVLAAFLAWKFYLEEPDSEYKETRDFLKEINTPDGELDKIFSMSFAFGAAIAIPARMASSRFPGKPLANLGGKRVIERVWENCKKSQKAEKVVILTDSLEICDFAKSIGADCIATSPECASGTERIIEALSELNSEFIVNVQGDEPFLEPSLIDLIIDARERTGADLVTACEKITDASQLENPNVVKVLRNNFGRAVYFSRCPLPFVRDSKNFPEWLSKIDYWRHIGIYGYSAHALATYAELPVSRMEKCEMLEQLRFISAGKTFEMVETSYASIGIDTPDDLIAAEKYLENFKV